MTDAVDRKKDGIDVAHHPGQQTFVLFHAAIVVQEFGIGVSHGPVVSRPDSCDMNAASDPVVIVSVFGSVISACGGKMAIPQQWVMMSHEVAGCDACWRRGR